MKKEPYKHGYVVGVKCSKCGFRGALVLPEEVRVCDQECLDCGSKDLKRRPDLYRRHTGYTDLKAYEWYE